MKNMNDDYPRKALCESCKEMREEFEEKHELAPFFCISCTNELGPEILKSLEDPFEYEVKITTGDSFTFHTCSRIGEWLKIGGITHHNGKKILNAKRFERGMQIRLSQVVYFCDAPMGS